MLTFILCAMQTIDALEAESKKLKQMAAKIDALIDDLKGMQGTEKPAAAPARESKPAPAPAPNGTLESMSISEAIRDVLMASGPATKSELQTRLAGRGKEVIGTSLSATLSRGANFVNRDGKWHLDES